MEQLVQTKARTIPNGIFLGLFIIISRQCFVTRLKQK